MPKRKRTEEYENDETLDQKEDYSKSEEEPEETPEPLEITTIVQEESQSGSKGVRVLFRLKKTNNFKIAIKGSDEYKKIITSGDYELIKDPLN